MLVNQMRAIGQAGFSLVAISAAGIDTPAIREAGIRHITVPMTRRVTPFADLVALIRLVRVFRRERFDIVHTHTPKAGLLGQYAALLAGVPVRIHTIHGLYFPGHMSPGRRWIYVLMERITMAFSHLNLSQNAEDIPIAIADSISRPDRIEFLGNGIDLMAYDPDTCPAERKKAVRAKLGLAPHHLVVGIVARFVAEKGYRELLDAARMIAREQPQVRFLFIGGFESEKADGLHPDIVRQYDLTNVVSLLGHRTDVGDLYAAMDIFTLPSHREGVPRSVMEAAAMGLPAVVSDVRGCRQTVTHNETGYIVPVKDAKALAAALLALITDEGKRRSFGAAARLKAKNEFDERAVFDHVIDAYQRLTRRRSQDNPKLIA